MIPWCPLYGPLQYSSITLHHLASLCSVAKYTELRRCCADAAAVPVQVTRSWVNTGSLDRQTWRKGWDTLRYQSISSTRRRCGSFKNQSTAIRDGVPIQCPQENPFKTQVFHWIYHCKVERMHACIRMNERLSDSLMAWVSGSLTKSMNDWMDDYMHWRR